MRILLFSLLFAYAWKFAPAQNRENPNSLDSLERVIASARVDSVRILALCQLANDLGILNRFDEGVEAAQKALELSRRAGFRKGEYLAEMKLASLYDPSGRASEALPLAQHALWGFRQLGLSEETAMASNALGNVHLSLSQLDSATYCYQQSIALFRRLADPSPAASPLLNLAQVKRQLGQLAQAIQLYQDAYRYAKAGAHLGLRVQALQGLAITHNANQRDDLAVQYYDQALQILDSCQCKPKLYSSLAYNAALSYLNLKQRPKSIQLLEAALQVARSINYWPILAHGASSLGLLRLETNQAEAARPLFEEALQAARQVNWPDVVASVQYNLGQYYLQKGHAAQARQMARAGLAYDSAARSIDGLRIGYQLLYRSDSALGDFRAAFDHYKLWQIQIDSLRSLSQTVEIARREAQFQARQEIETLNIRRQAEREQANWVIGSVSVISVLLLGMTFLLFRGRRKEHRANQALRQLNSEILNQKAEIEAQNSEIIAQRDQLEALDRLKEMLTGMVVHDLKNPLNTVLGLSTLPPDAARLRMIRQAGQQMTQLVINLLDIQKYESNELHLQLANWSAFELIAQALEQVDFLAESKRIEFDLTQLDAQLQIEADADLFIRVWVNLLTNAIKYAPDGDRLLIEGRLDASHRAIFRLTDHGPGIPPDQLERIFDKFSQIDGGRSSGRLRSTGLGLTFCRLTIEAHGGSIGAESQPGRYTTFTFSLPVARISEAAVSLIPTDTTPSQTVFPAIPPELNNQPLLLEQLRQIPIYEVSQLIDCLNRLPDDPETAVWKSAIERAAFAGDTEAYLRLLR